VLPMHTTFKRDEYMELIREPTYVKKFKCSNRWCTDTCCCGFEIELDNTSIDVYNGFTGELKELIHEGVIRKDEKVYIRNEEGRCVFLNDNNLCKLQIIGGEGALCYTCRIYPRFMLEHNNIHYIGLSLSCPTASLLIMDGDEFTYPFYSSEEDIKISTHAALLEKEYYLLTEVIELFLKLNKREFDLDDYLHINSNKSKIFKNTLSSKDTLNLCRYFYFRYQSEDNNWKNISYWFIGLASMLINNNIITRYEIYKLAKEIEHSDTNISFLNGSFSYYETRIEGTKKLLKKED